MASLVLTDQLLKSLRLTGPGPALQQEVYDAKVPGLTVRITAKGTKTFSYCYYMGGKRRRLKLGRYPHLTLAEARAKATEAMLLVDQGTDPLALKQRVRNDYSKQLFPAVAYEFVERYAKPRAKDWRERESILRRHFCERWSKVPISDIKRADIAHTISEIAANGRPTASLAAFVVLRKLLGWAVEHGYIAQNPCDGLSPPPSRPPRDRVLSSDELARIWAASSDMGYPFGTLVKLLILTGQRRNEIADLRWGEINLKDRLLSLPSQRTKSKRPHAVPLSPRALELLAVIPKLDDEFVFPSKRGQRPISGFSKWKAEIDRRSSVTAWRLHDIRRTVATGLSLNKVEQHVVESICNHATGKIGTVARIYNRNDFLDEKRAALELWAAVLDKTFSTDP